jgi:hypothetical protein
VFLLGSVSVAGAEVVIASAVTKPIKPPSAPAAD